MENENADASQPMIRTENVQLGIVDIGVGWSELQIFTDAGEVRSYAFSLVWDPFEDIRQFERAVAAGKSGQMILRGEPGAVEVEAIPDEREGWVRLTLWVINHREDREQDFEALCPASGLAQSMRTRIGFLAREAELSRRKEEWRRFWRRPIVWLQKQR
jgi:hypothetical protein